MGIQTIVDARELLPPEPFEKTLEALDLIQKPGDEVLLLLHREPFPLYGVLERNGYAHATACREDGCFEIHIFRN